MQTKSESTNDRLQPSSLPITVAGVTKSYGALQVLSDINLHIKSGEFLTLLGPSGSGKTTLLMTLAGFIRPDLGSLKFGEEEVVLKAPHLRRVGMMFQNYALFPHMSVEANIGYPLKIRGEDRATIKSKFKAYLKRSSWVVTDTERFPNSRAANGNGLLSLGRSSSNRKSSSWTSRYLRSTRTSGSSCNWSCATCMSNSA